MVKARKYLLKTRFQGLPKREDYEIIDQELPPIKNGEILIKVEWVSVDPYLRIFTLDTPLPYDQFGFHTGIVEDSKDPRYPVGTRVMTHRGWCDYCIVDTTVHHEDPAERVYKLPNLRGLSNSLGVGIAGMPGATAYFGLLEICQPKTGETLVVTGAAGAVGSIVGQIGKIKGCRVIGFAGSDEKVKWLEEIGFDKAYNYKTVDVTAALKEAAPNGVDCYFDNVGGEISSLIIYQMNLFGRVAVCGSISTYNDDDNKHVKVGILQPTLNAKQIRIEGFMCWRWIEKWQEGFTQIVQWILDGKLKPREHITEGFENIFDAFVGMLQGENYGKAVIKL